jgi:glycolate oxidase
MGDRVEELKALLGAEAVRGPEEIDERYWHDEALSVSPSRPAALALPESAGQIVELVQWARSRRVGLVARGAGTGLSGGAVCDPREVCVSTEALRGVVDLDERSGVAVVRAGTTLTELDAVLAPVGLRYTVSPGEDGATIGGTVATNAGGMRAVRYGTTRQNVRGLTVVVGTGETLSLGGALAKRSSGYDLVGLMVGSEGTLGIVERAIVRVEPRAAAESLLVGRFGAVRDLVGLLAPLARLEPPASIVEYVDAPALDAMARHAGVALGIPASALAEGAVLLVGLERQRAEDLEADVARAGEMLAGAGAEGIWVLSDAQARAVIRAREGAFWTVRALGAREILDVVVPIGALAAYLDEVTRIAAALGVGMPATGHVGDGNVHLSIFADDQERAARAAEEVIAAGVRYGGAVSGEHGIGRAKRAALAAHAPAAELRYEAEIKRLFDPDGILAPGRIFSLD